MKKIIYTTGLFLVGLAAQAQETVVTRSGKETTVNKDASSSEKGRIKLAGDLGGTADVPVILAGAITPSKVAPGANNTVFVTDNTGTVIWISKTAFGAVADMITIEGDGTASSPFKVKDLSIITDKLANNSVTSPKIEDGTIVTADLADGSITNAKLGETITVTKGGTGANMSSSIGYVKQASSGANFTTVALIPVTEVSGAVQKVNGSTPDADGNVAVAFGTVYTGTLANRGTVVATPDNGDIYVVSGDATTSNNGNTYIYDGTTWQEVTVNQSSLDARYLKLAGGTMAGDIDVPAGKKIVIADQAVNATDAANKAYVDSLVAGATPDASTTVKGKIQLAGDLGGTADLPTVPGLANKENTITVGTTSQYWRGDKTWQTLDKSAVGLGNVDNTSDASKPISSATQTALDLKAPLASPALTGTPTAPTATAGTNTTQIATTAFVTTAVAAASIPDATTSSKGKVRLAGDLSGTADAPTVPGLATKENTITAGTTTQYWRGDKTWQTLDKTAVGLGNVDNTSDLNKPISSATQAALDLKASLSSPTLTGTPAAPTAAAGTNTTQIATTAFVTSAISTAAVGDATTLVKGKIQLGGDLGGTGTTAAAPIIKDAAISTNKLADDAVTSAKIVNGTVATIDLADASITNAKLGETVSVAKGGTGTTTLTGYVKGNGTSAFTSVALIPVTEVSGAVAKVNGSTPNALGEVTIAFGTVFTGTFANRAIVVSSPNNGDIYVVSGDSNSANNGNTYIFDGTTWQEVTANQASLDARYLKLAGGTMSGNITVPTGKKIIITDQAVNATDAANKAYVDAQITAATPDATSTVKGKIQLAGDLGGTAAAPTVPGLANKENAITAGTAAQYYRGDKSWQTLDKTAVGLNNVDNISDVNKPISSATQAALDLKAPLASPTLTGTPAAPTAASGTNTAQIATTAFVTAAVATATPDATTTVKGKIKLAGDLGGTADLPTVPGLASKQNTLTLTTTGSGAATLTGATLNIPTPAAGSPFTLQGTSTDAGSDKTSVIDRTGSIEVKSGYFKAIANGNTFVLDPTEATGPRLKLGPIAIPNGYLELGAYNSMNNFDTKARDFNLMSTAKNNALFLKNDTGFIGIGVGNPLSLFSNAASTTNFVSSNNSIQSTNGISWLNSASGYTASLYNSNTGAGANGLQVKVANTSNQTIALEVGQNATLSGTSTPLFNVLGNGNVGIGTNAPSTKLEITSGTAGTSGLKFTNLTNTASTVASTKFLSLDATGNVIYATTGLTLPLITANGTNSATTEVRDYNTWANRGNGFYLTDLGGAIGNGIPNVGAYFALSQVANGSGYFGQTTLNDQGFWFRGGTTAEIANNKWFRTISVNAISRFAAQWDNSTNHTITLNNVDNGPLAFATNNTERMRILAAGNVGIATSTPQTLLDIAPSAGASSMTIGTVGTTANDQVNINFATKYDRAGGMGTANNRGWQLGARGNTWASPQTNVFYASYWDGTTWTQPLTLTPGGLVGIGTTTPTSRFEVNGSATNTAAFNAAAATTINFAASNLAYTTASAGAFTLTNMKDGGTYTLAVQGATSGTASFTITNPSGATLTPKLVNNGPTTANKHTLYTFLVIGTNVYVYMATGF